MFDNFVKGFIYCRFLFYMKSKNMNKLFRKVGDGWVRFGLAFGWCSVPGWFRVVVLYCGAGFVLGSGF